MAARRLQLKRRYSRADPRGQSPRISGYPDLDHNRLGVFWRPIIDITDAPYTALKLRAITPVARWLTEPATRHRSWFAIIGVPGLRRQVLSHAGLQHLDCTRPEDVPVEYRTPLWQSLVDLTCRYDDLDDNTRCLLVFHLAQLSLTGRVFALAGTVHPNGSPDHDRYAYEVARVHSRHPDHYDQAMPAFDALAHSTADPVLALAAAAQGVGHAIRDARDVALASKFAAQGQHIIRIGLPDDWHSDLVRSRFHRAVALLRGTERDAGQMRAELAATLQFGNEVLAAQLAGADRLVAEENRRIAIESTIRSVMLGRSSETDAEIHALSTELASIDPYCVEALIIAGDGYAAAGDYPEAAKHYCRAGQLGTTAGAMGWFRAGQCYDFLGDRAAAVNAMGRCLELDSSAIEPREYLDSHSRASLAIIAHAETEASAQ